MCRSAISILTLALAVSPLGACGGDGGGGGAADAGVADAGPPTSEKANLRFKRAARLENDYTQALGLAPGTLCNEVGKFSCAGLVHLLTLGGVEPYTFSVYEAAEPGLTTPVAVERLALSGCALRADADLAAPGAALIFKNLALDAGGGLADVDAAEVAAAIDTLYRRALGRRAAAREIDELRQLYRDVEAAATAGAARHWATLACFAVLTGEEALFY